MTEKKENVAKNYFPVRVNNATTLELLNDLIEEKVFDSTNILINKILDAGIVDFARRYLKKKISTTGEPSEEQQYSVPRGVKQVEHTVDDMYVVVSLLEYLVTSIFNERCATLAGEKVSAENMRAGHYSELTSGLQEVKKLIDRQQTKRSEK